MDQTDNLLTYFKRTLFTNTANALGIFCYYFYLTHSM